MNDKKNRIKGFKKIEDKCFQLNNNLELQKNFSKKIYRENFYNFLAKSYPLEGNKIKIQRYFIAPILFDYSLNNNKQLEILKKENNNKYIFIKEQLFLRVNFEIEELIRRVSIWSEEKIFLEVNNKNISLVNKNKDILLLKKEEMIKKYSQNICECVFLFDSKINEINFKIKSIINQNLIALF